MVQKVAEPYKTKTTSFKEINLFHFIEGVSSNYSDSKKITTE